VQLHEKYGEQVVGISLNVDYDGSEENLSPQLQSQIESVLTKLKVTCENVISSDPMDDVLKDFDIFGLPAVVIYDAQGSLHTVFEGTVSYGEQVFPEVEKLLASG
jgi:hypothetical protein